MERKCPHCGTWNKEVERCSNCGELIDPEKIKIVEQTAKEKRKLLLRKPNKLDAFFEKFSNSKNPLVQIIYYLLYSVWLIFAVIVGFILYVVALAPG